MKKIYFIFSILLMNTIISKAQKINTDFLPNLLATQPEQFKELLDNPEKYRLQILYTQIDRDKNNRPKFTSYGYRINDTEYFYPASTVKFPASALALEKINNLNIKGLTKETAMLTGAEYERHTPVTKDTTSENGLPSVAHYIKKILMVSDNDAFNRLYEFLGQDGFNDALHKKGYENTRIFHRLQVGMNKEQNRRTNPIKFVSGNEILYQQPMVISEKNYSSPKPIGIGKGYMQGDSVVNTPFDFKDRNFYPLLDQQSVLKSIIFPEAVEAKKRFNLTDEDYQFLYKYMSQMPTESVYPNYNPTEFYPTYCKFMLYGSGKNDVPNPSVRIFNKVGDAYGFLLDNAYIVDFEKGIEFMVSAVLLCNKDEIFNDDKYDYDTIGFPFMKNLGQLLYNYELARLRKHKPDLSKFKIVYDK
ncbi:beta-lactamase family protein [Arcicella aurantiaca]|uniref:beta-lactamase n=1 Tax=Arcicella aurantiaca TaxID=591202 RepID=A0A316DGX0_9BACT|nr:serine hydrolase [Arcicella aurantiaca]PWK16762.1 beta-lactamase family protein [Arcicella aurantiaca]